MMREKKWVRWWAWYPVWCVDTGGFAWLGMVWRSPYFVGRGDMGQRETHEYRRVQP